MKMWIYEKEDSINVERFVKETGFPNPIIIDCEENTLNINCLSFVPDVVVFKHLNKHNYSDYHAFLLRMSKHDTLIIVPRCSLDVYKQLLHDFKCDCVSTNLRLIDDILEYRRNLTAAQYDF